MNEANLATIWVYLSASPLFGLTITLIAYSLAYRLYIFAGSHSLLHPVVSAVALLIAVLLVTDMSYAVYFEGGQYVHFLLGPATVALAVPLFQQLSKLKKLWLPVAIAIISGTVIGAFIGAVLVDLIDMSLVRWQLVSEFWREAVLGALILLSVAADATLRRRLVAWRVAREKARTQRSTQS